MAEADSHVIEQAARGLGDSARYLAPLGWAAGTIVLLVTGGKLLILNWRLSLMQLVPAFWVWVTMWDLKAHLFKGGSFGHVSLTWLLVVAGGIVALTVAAFWCNVVFAFAIEGPPPPRIAPAVRKARAGLRTIVVAGLVMGGAIALCALVVPRVGGIWLFGVAMGTVLAAMLVSFVAVPAHIIGVTPTRLPMKQKVSGLAVGGALSAVAIAPGFLLDRLGLVFLGIHALHVVGFVLLSVGIALYAAGESSVKAVKLSSKLVSGPT